MAHSLLALLATAALAVAQAAAYAVVDAGNLPGADTASSSDSSSAAVARRVPTPAGPGFLHLDIVHSTSEAHFGKRAVQLTLANRSDVAYYAKLEFGTPAQAQYVQLDTGSFELWVNPTCDDINLSSGDQAFCDAVGTFDPAASSTFTALNTGKTLRYGIGSANITYGTDDIALPGSNMRMTGVQFGVATSTIDAFSGILGIGYGLNLTTRYPNFVDELAAQGLTATKAFSLALGSKTEKAGSIIFGGLDTSKFAGSLAQLPITPARFSPDGVPRYWVNMSSMALATSATAAKTYAGSEMQVFLDSGSTLTLLPADLVDAIAADFDATPANGGFYLVDCAVADAPGTLDFRFDGTTIRVPFRELVRQSGNQCMLGLQASSNFALLGDTFMRSAYVVIDQTDNNVWMAPYTNCGSTPAALASSSSLQSIVGACAVNGSNANASADPVTSEAASVSAATTATATSKTTAATAATVSTAAEIGATTVSGVAAATSAASASASASVDNTVSAGVPLKSSALASIACTVAAVLASALF